MEIQQRIVEVIKRNFADFDPAHALAEQLDSLQLFTLMVALEKEFDIHFAPIELRTENTEDLAKITALVEAKLK